MWVPNKVHFYSDPFADASAETSDSKGVQSGHIHIRIQQRNGRKTLTTVQGISDDYDKKKLVRYAKRVNFSFPWPQKKI